jgi:hypothetical protein
MPSSIISQEEFAFVADQLTFFSFSGSFVFSWGRTALISSHSPNPIRPIAHISSIRTPKIATRIADKNSIAAGYLAQ